MFSSIIMLIFSMIMIMISLTLLMKNMFIHLNLNLMSMLFMNIPVSFILDWMSSMFMATVMFISSMILMFSMFYIPKKEQKQFNLLLMMFIISMLLLIISDNIIFIMLGWDGLGLSSYILVIFYQNYDSSSSGSITIFTNRIGDILIILSMSIMTISMNWNFSMENKIPMITMLMLMLAACTKSAQFPFSAWLPAAMAAPTPISALVHSSTLVTAGIFLMIRISNFFHPWINVILMIISSMTILYSSISAMWEQDMKKIIALSTLSQMAMMMFAISLKLPMMAYFHLITHALFKSTMFLCAGTMIHNSSYQDMRMMTPLFKNSPITMYSLGISNMALMGIPFTSGFFSKDMIVENSMSSKLYSFLSFMLLISIMMTSMYSMKMIMKSTKFNIKSNPTTFNNKNIFSDISISIMTPTSIIIGTMMIWILPMNQSLNLPLMLKYMIIIMLILAILFSITMKTNFKKSLLNKMISSLWYLNFISKNLFNFMYMNMLTMSKMDMSWQENYGPQMIFSLNKKMSLFPDLMTSTIFTTILILMTPLILMS